MGFLDGSDGSLPAMQETQVQSLGEEDPLEKGMAMHSSVLALEIPWTEEPGGLQSMEPQRVPYPTQGGSNVNNFYKGNLCLEPCPGQVFQWLPTT